MQEALDIQKQKQDGYWELLLNGRLDAFGSRMLEDELQDQIKEGHYTISLNFKDVVFLSSAGIRILIKLYKELKGIGGFLKFTDLPDKISEVVELAGLSSLFNKDDKVEAKKENRKEVAEEKSESGIFKIIDKKDIELKASVAGNTDLLANKGFTDKDIQVENFGGDKYALGLGAIGDNFDDCKERFGEFMAVNDTAIYLPSDGTKSVDFMSKSNQLIPKVTSLYHLLFEGEFGTFLNFDRKDDSKYIPLSEIASTLFKIQDATAIGMVMIAETSGLCGCSITQAPVNGKHNVFAYPSIKENVNFTTEPEHDGCLTLTVGIIQKGIEGFEKFTRPLGDTGLYAHFHTAVLDFNPIQKDDADLKSLVKGLLENNNLRGLLHLLDDNRPHNGIGESGFVRGSCWMGTINELKNRS